MMAYSEVRHTEPVFAVEGLGLPERAAVATPHLLPSTTEAPP